MNTGHERLLLISGDNDHELSQFACTVLFNTEMSIMFTETKNA